MGDINRRRAAKSADPQFRTEQQVKRTTLKETRRLKKRSSTQTKNQQQPNKKSYPLFIRPIVALPSIRDSDLHYSKAPTNSPRAKQHKKISDVTRAFPSQLCHTIGEAMLCHPWCKT